MAKLTERLFAVPDGDIYPRWFEVGEDVTGGVERSARSRGIVAAEPVKKPSKPTTRKAMTAPENK